MNRETLARCPKYLDWIRSLPCIVSDVTDGVIAHHITIGAQRGISQKPSDFWCVPLRWDLHDKLHQMGERKFWTQLGYDPDGIHRAAAVFVLGFVEKHHPDDGLELLRHLNEFAAERYGK